MNGARFSGGTTVSSTNGIGRRSPFMLPSRPTDFLRIDQIADAAASPLPDVIDFVNAYHAIGFVENDAVRPADPATAEAAKGGMLSRLRNPFAR